MNKADKKKRIISIIAISMVVVMIFGPIIGVLIALFS